MKRSIIIVWLMLLPGLLGCGLLAGLAPGQPAEDGSTGAAFVTASPTFPPPDTPAPTPTQVVESTPGPTELAAATDTPVPEPTLSATDTPMPEPTATFTPEPDWLNSVGRTADNLVYLGNPEAPVTIIDYSDFM